jgi:hypothetical protein
MILYPIDSVLPSLIEDGRRSDPGTDRELYTMGFFAVDSAVPNPRTVNMRIPLGADHLPTDGIVQAQVF